MKIFRRLSFVCLAVLAFAPSANASTDGNRPALHAVTGVQGFELSANEQAGHEFARTPSFAWSPVRSAATYEFELATSRTFTENAIIWSSSALKSPAVAIPISLPWITGSPYSLYAHVRAHSPGGVGPWSAPYGFNMRWSTVAKPLPSYPGMVRWTPVVGATGYEVWLLDAGHLFTTYTNVADEREYFSFHQSQAWSGVVHWRIRAERYLYGSTANGLPAHSFGPWSPVYTSYNPPFQVGSLTTGATVSDVVTDAKHRALHQLMPGFAFSGNRSSFSRVTTELYRVYVFTDRDCLNVVYRGAVVGSPAYAPRPVGSLALPQSQTEIAAARDGYLLFGGEGSTFSYDGVPVVSSEDATNAAAPPAETGGGDAPPGGGDDKTGGGTNGSGTSVPASVIVQGARVGLWDDDWSSGGYYWTVVPVQAVPEETLTTSLALAADAKASAITVLNPTGIGVGDVMTIGNGVSPEVVTVASVEENTITLEGALKQDHSAGETVLRLAGGVKYIDAELTQDACSSGRVQTFGKSSTPIVTSSRIPYATGLSTGGRLVAASRARPVFYGSPLVSWQPADSAIGYEVQWSRTKYPWKTAGNSFTFSTSALLKLRPGTWYYRVRGYDPMIPGPTRQMSWSAVASLTVAKPAFKLVSG